MAAALLYSWNGSDACVIGTPPDLRVMCIKPRNINFDPYFCPTMSTLSCVSSTDSSFPPSPPLSPSPSTFDSHSVSSASSPSSSPSHLSSPSPRQYILPSSHFANKKFLRGLSETLGKGAGDLLFLCVPRVDAPITKLDLALKEVAKSIGCEIAESWMQIITVVKGKSLCPFVYSCGLNLFWS